jgi:hypothetical protein
VKRARQSLFTLRRVKIFGVGSQILKRFYNCTIESILTGFITSCYGNCSTSDRNAQDIYIWLCQRKALKIVKDSSHPGRLFSLLLHGKQYRSASFYSFYPQAIRPLNSKSKGYPDPSFTLLLLSVYNLCIVTLTLPTCTYYFNYLN